MKDAAWMSAIWGRFGAALWSILALIGITIAAPDQQEAMNQGFELIKSGWAFAGQAAAFIATVLSIVSKIREGME